MIRLAIVDDHASVRQSLRAFFGAWPDLQVVAEGRNGAQAASIAVRHAPDVLLMDLAMPGQNGRDALEVIRAQAPQVGVLILSGYPQELYAGELLERGAAGFVHKNCEPEQIVEAIRTVAAGRIYGLSPQASPRLCVWPAQLRPAADAAA